jgi:hypothetical protein
LDITNWTISRHDLSIPCRCSLWADPTFANLVSALCTASAEQHMACSVTEILCAAWADVYAPHSYVQVGIPHALIMVSGVKSQATDADPSIPLLFKLDGITESRARQLPTSSLNSNKEQSALDPCTGDPRNPWNTAIAR